MVKIKIHKIILRTMKDTENLPKHLVNKSLHTDIKSLFTMDPKSSNSSNLLPEMKIKRNRPLFPTFRNKKLKRHWVMIRLYLKLMKNIFKVERILFLIDRIEIGINLALKGIISKWKLHITDRMLKWSKSKNWMILIL